MNCRDVREVADSFLTDQLLTETNHEILQHLDTCPSCRTEIDARRRLRGALRDAFNRAPELQPSAELRNRLRDQLREAPAHRARAWSLPRQWLALAAGVVLTAGLASAVFLSRGDAVNPIASSDLMARDAIGDHRNCALKFRLVRKPVPLEEAAEQYDSAYRVLLSTPPDEIQTPDGPARVKERHSCAYGARRFGHVIMEYRGRVVSLLMTANDGAGRSVGDDAIPHFIGRPMNGLSVVSVTGTQHAILLVGDLDSGELAELSKAVSVPLAQRLSVNLMPDRGDLASVQFERPFQHEGRSFSMNRFRYQRPR